jgi:hypothetical protein
MLVYIKERSIRRIPFDHVSTPGKYCRHFVWKQEDFQKWLQTQPVLSKRIQNGETKYNLYLSERNSYKIQQTMHNLSEDSIITPKIFQTNLGADEMKEEKYKRIQKEQVLLNLGGFNAEMKKIPSVVTPKIKKSRLPLFPIPTKAEAEASATAAKAETKATKQKQKQDQQQQPLLPVIGTGKQTIQVDKSPISQAIQQIFCLIAEKFPQQYKGITFKSGRRWEGKADHPIGPTLDPGEEMKAERKAQTKKKKTRKDEFKRSIDCELQEVQYNPAQLKKRGNKRNRLFGAFAMYSCFVTNCRQFCFRKAKANGGSGDACHRSGIYFRFNLDWVALSEMYNSNDFSEPFLTEENKVAAKLKEKEGHIPFPANKSPFSVYQDCNACKNRQQQLQQLPSTLKADPILRIPESIAQVLWPRYDIAIRELSEGRQTIATKSYLPQNDFTKKLREGINLSWEERGKLRNLENLTYESFALQGLSIRTWLPETDSLYSKSIPTLHRSTSLSERNMEALSQEEIFQSTRSLEGTRLPKRKRIQREDTSFANFTKSLQRSKTVYGM